MSDQTTTPGSTGAGTPPPETTAPAGDAQGSLLNGGAPEASKGNPSPSAPPASPPVPEKYSFTLPTGLDKDDALIAEVSSYAKAAGLSAEQAQKLLDAQHQAEAKLAETYEAAQAKSRDDAIAQLKADPDFGGEKYAESISKARSAITRFLTKPEIAQLEKDGLGNNPALIRAFARIGRAIGEDSVIKAAGTAAPAPRSLEERFTALFAKS